MIEYRSLEGLKELYQFCYEKAQKAQVMYENAYDEQLVSHLDEQLTFWETEMELCETRCLNLLTNAYGGKLTKEQLADFAVFFYEITIEEVYYQIEMAQQIYGEE